MTPSSLVELFLPASVRTDPVLARHLRLVVAVCLVGAVLLPPFALRHLLVTHNAVAGYFTLSLGIVGVVLPVLLRAGVPLSVLVHGLAGAIAAGTFAISVSRGGFIIAPILSNLFIPLVLGLLRMRRGAAVWGVVVVLHYLVLASITEAGLFGLHRATAFDAPQLIGFAVFVTFITLLYDAHRESLEKQNAELYRQLAETQRAEAIGQLAAGVAHDFNNLLTVVRTSADAMLTELPANHPLQPDARAVSQAADRGATITRQLLQFARGKASEEVAFDVGGAVGQMLPLLQRLVTRKISIRWVPPKQSCVVLGDPRQFEHVVLNLVANARDAMPSGGEISLGVERRELAGDRELAAGPYVVVSVRDTGGGIAPAALPHIFEPFFTTKTRGTGTGLGLAMSQGTVQAMGGRIHVETSSEGTLFEVLLPRSDAAASVRPPERPRAPSVPDALPPRGTVLVVDDQVAVAEVTRRLLVAEGFAVLVADGPRRALELVEAREGDIDVLVTDVLMPEMSGHALAQRVRAASPNVPVVYMSGHSDDAGVREEVERGVAQFVRKPFDRASLLASLDAALSRAAD